MYKELNKLRAVHGSYDDLLSGTGAMATTDFSQADMGDNPAVNIATGRLRYSFDDLSVGYGNFAVNVGHVYLSQHFSAFVNRFPELSSGWKLNVAQFVVADKTPIGESPVMLYMDEAGEVHRFVKFDDTRYYDERNAKITLYVGGDSTFDNIFIEDDVGNRIYFNQSGRVEKTVACHNRTMVKMYKYDENNRLIAIYDNRVVNSASGAIKTQILFVYDYANRLASATAYVNYNKILASINYKYDSNGRLTQVDRVAYNRKNRQCLVTPSLGFEYANRLLTQATDLETKSAYRFTYADDKISKVEQGVIGSDSVGTGAADADGNSLAYCGNGLYCGAPAKTEFVRKASNSYDYYYDGGDSAIASETDVTNQNGITLAYFINRDACVVSSFEKSYPRLYTLEKQGAKNTGIIMGGVSTARINQETAFTVNGTYTVLDNAKFEVTRNDQEQGLRSFDYSFWLKLPVSSTYMQAKIVYKFANADERTSVTLIDGKAVNAWQRVSLPLSAPLSNRDDSKTDTLSYLKVQLLSNNKLYTGAYDFSEIGFAPASNSEFYYILSAPMSKLSRYKLTILKKEGSSSSQNVFSETTEGVIGSLIYFTESDVLASVRNRVKKMSSIGYHSFFDIICNNGTKRIPYVEAIVFNYNGIWFEPSFSPSIKVNMPDGKTEITTMYKYGPQTINIEITGEREGIKSSKTVEADYFGKTLKETDEYGVSKNYTYNAYGDVTKVQIVGSKGTIGSAMYYHYDDEGRLLQSHDGVTGQSIDYTEYDQANAVTEGKISNGTFNNTSHNVTNKYGVFRDNTLAVSEYNNGKQLSHRDVTYEQGRIRTVSDGLSKYGVKYNLANDTVDYTQFDDMGAEKLIQRDSIQTDRSNYVCQKHRSEFYEDNAVKDSATTELTKYGKVNAVTYRKEQGGEVCNTYAYDRPNESVFASLLATYTDNDNGTTTDYYYNDDGELMRWEEKNGDGTENVKVQKISDNVTKYSFGLGIEYMTEITDDSEKILSPRVVETKLHRKYSEVTDDLWSHYNPLKYSYDEFGRLSAKYCHHTTTNYDYVDLAGKSRLQCVLFEYGDRSFSPAYKQLVKTVDELDYYNDGKLKSSKLWVGQKNHEEQEWELNQTVKSSFNYDSLERLTDVEVNKNGVVSTQHVRYNDDGRISHATIKGKDIDFNYNSLGQMSRVGDYTYKYDNYGNRIEKRNGYNDLLVTEYKYARGGQLIQAGSIQYSYNQNGVLCKKINNGSTAKFLLDGNKILGVDIYGGNSYALRFMYDLTGLNFVSYNDVDYEYVLDSQGNVIMLIDSLTDRIVARYEYDIFGNCTVYNADNEIDTDPTSIGNINPFRWKGFYYDTDTGLYYANGSFYDPATVSYVDAAPIESIFSDVFTARRLDRTGLLCDNILELAGNPHNIYTTCELAADTTYTPKYTWLTKVEMKIAQWVRRFNKLPAESKLVWGTLVLMLAVGITIMSHGSTVAILTEMVLGVGFGLAMWAVTSLLNRRSLTMDGAVNAAMDAFLLSSIFVFITAGVNAIKYLCRSKPVTTAELANEVTQNKHLEFESQAKLEKHFAQHGKEFKGLYSNSQEYLQGANYVINNGTFVAEMNGYVRFFGTGRRGAEYAFVGLTHDATHITTFGIRNIKSLSNIPWLIP